MSFYSWESDSTEYDTLLPKNKSSPEILGSRPQSIGDEYRKEREDQDEFQDRSSMIRYLTRNWPGILFGVSLVLFLGMIVLDLQTPIHDTPVDRNPLPKTVEERVNRILTDTPLIDGHNDLAVVLRFIYHNQIYSKACTKPFEEGGAYAHVDLPRLKKGQNGGAFWSAFAPCPADGYDFSDKNYADTVAFTYSQLDVLKRLQAAYPTHFSLPPNSSTAMAAFKDDLLISPLIIEGLHQIGNSVSNLRNYHSLGVRYATLTHNCHNNYADAALTEVKGGGVMKAVPFWGGVSPAGQLLIKEMNRLGMIVDLAHVSSDTMRDVLGGSKNWTGSAAPIIFSHSSAYSVCPHPRNVPDDILKLVKKRNSVVMVNFSPDFVSCIANPDNKNGMPDFYPQNSTIHQVVRHIKHIGDLIGYEHVGLGSDFDGIPTTPEGLEDVSKFPDLVAELLKAGISDEQASMIVGANVLRVWKEVDAVALKMQKEGVPPLEDDL